MQVVPRNRNSEYPFLRTKLGLTTLLSHGGSGRERRRAHTPGHTTGMNTESELGTPAF